VRESLVGERHLRRPRHALDPAVGARSRPALACAITTGCHEKTGGLTPAQQQRLESEGSSVAPTT